MLYKRKCNLYFLSASKYWPQLKRNNLERTNNTIPLDEIISHNNTKSWGSEWKYIWVEVRADGLPVNMSDDRSSVHFSQPQQPRRASSHSWSFHLSVSNNQLWTSCEYGRLITTADQLISSTAVSRLYCAFLRLATSVSGNQSLATGLPGYCIPLLNKRILSVPENL